MPHDPDRRRAAQSLKMPGILSQAAAEEMALPPLFRRTSNAAPLSTMRHDSGFAE
jgi:hypothetical protein